MCIRDRIVATHPGRSAGRLVNETIRYGASPRGGQAIMLGAKALALFDGRYNVSFDDVAAVAPAALAIHASMRTAAHALETMAAPASLPWEAWTQACNADYVANLQATPIKDLPADTERGLVDMHSVIATVQKHLPLDAVLTNGAGNFASWLHRFYRYSGLASGHKTQLAPTNGAMGYGVPAAVAASLQYSDRTVIGFCGDGGFMMTGQELATAIHHKVKPIIIVCNNSMYGTIRMHQEREFPGRVSGTALTNPDFVKLGESYGAFSARVNNANDFKKLWPEASRSGKACLLYTSEAADARSSVDLGGRR